MLFNLKKFINFLNDKNTFTCFSPGVMISTFLIEIILAIYVYLKYKMTAFSRLIILLLIFLATFQLAEYQICTGNYSELWTKIGFVSITFLPALGLQLISLVTESKKFLKLGYILMVGFILFFIFYPTAINGAVCGGNYIIFNTHHIISWLYAAYYLGFLLIGILESAKYLQHNRNQAAKWMLAGYISFTLPMTIIYLMFPEARSAIPSIMCGFAIFLALILAFKVAPLSSYYQHKNLNKF